MTKEEIMGRLSDDGKGLYLTYTEVTDGDLAHLKGLNELEWLCLRNTKITDYKLS